jgi:hypothetical protein
MPLKVADAASLPGRNAPDERHPARVWQREAVGAFLRRPAILLLWILRVQTAPGVLRLGVPWRRHFLPRFRATRVLFFQYSFAAERF